jgi:diguanylate cyclase (GGDEF)-like protein
VSEPTQRPARPVDPSDQRIRRSWFAFGTAYVALILVALARVVTTGATPLDWVLLILVGVAGVAAVAHAAAAAGLDERRRGETESFARILSALSRSVSPDAIVDAIVEELSHATDADHIVVVRRRPDTRVLEARLVSSRQGIPDSTTLLPIADLEDPLPSEASGGASVGAAARVVGGGRSPARTAAGRRAERIARRVRTVYGLTNTLASPLTVGDTVVGAIVVSRRSDRPWPEATRRILGGAAQEASASLERAYSQRAAEAQAATDALTGLPNRRYFDEFVTLLARRRRAGDAVGILMVDIDKFKALNDAHGHATGDEVLRAVAGAIVGAVREDDVPARFGGEEFVVLLRNPDPGVAVEVGERIRAAVRGLDLRRYGVHGVSVSVGVAVADEPDEPIESLIETADRALYRAKRAGRDRVVAA